MTDAEKIVQQLKLHISHMNAQPTYEGLCEKYGDSAVYAGVNLMEKTGGSFASSIAKAFFHADLANRRKLFSAFGDLFESFVGKAISYNETLN